MGETNEDRPAQAQREVSPRKLAKQMAIASASCTLFGREGYTRASVDALAAEAGVSTRTLYNHFPGGKAQLFQTVVTWTSSEVRDAQLAILRSVLDPGRPPHPDALERDLVALARAFVGLMNDYPNHFALVRHIHAEADHVPPEVLKAWHAAGPEPVGRAVTEAMAHLAEAGLLDVHGDPALTAGHFMALTSHTIVQLTHYGVLPLPQQETDRLITGGVAAFLRAYAAT
ncbi:TetR family transcriptional regulator [Streptomyces cellostaticus]|uniref:TetR family transcriptional regulator n=1 Tax=Streptomyces cellostaticus TaxID=67285 RepID=A0A101N6V3_9ACTN|nr:TetR/AcrR family transcriptional regulator [Streptomyces cellostaticus]KUM87539.1 TetR family transcriptional regulator [Streptomyces cellostaticus]GHI06620.1 TetR family transcriptional regulator [Streptomyces cellostaticus]